MQTSTLHPTSPASILASLRQHRGLIRDLVKRDFLGRYRGSILGVAWSLFHPLLMMAIYTLVFSVAFKARWGSGPESKVAFALVLFSGMIVHALFAECLNNAPSLVSSRPNYVKKIVFPLEILPWMTLCSALLHFLVSFAVLLVFCLIAGLPIHGGALLIPVVLLPLIVLTLGLTWLFAALGVYMRDLAQGMGLITTILLFLSPVFYPIESLPAAYRSLMHLNPITLPIIQLRELLLWDKPLNWSAWGVSLLIAAALSHMGYYCFQKARRGFADVL